MPNATIKVWHLLAGLCLVGAFVAGITAEAWNPVARDLHKVSQLVEPQVTLPGAPVEG